MLSIKGITVEVKENWQNYCKKRNLDVKNNPPECIEEHINLLKQDVDVMSGFITKILDLLEKANIKED